MKNSSLAFHLLSICLVFSSCGISKARKHLPDISEYNNQRPLIQAKRDSFALSDKGQLRKNPFGLYELYLSGDPLEMGLNNGAIAQDLIQKQEHIFFKKVEELVPSKSRQGFLRFFLAWYNRKIHKHISNELDAEIYGVSRYAADRYSYIADNYLRSLYLHGAHDIGHALQDLALVGCSSFAAWADKTEDGSMIVGRNFDFYAGDEFAEDKIIAFVAPDSGHKFMSVTWGGMIGVVSGMNEHGITLSINAGKSSIPLVAKTPIALLNREILQYASSIEEAIAIAKQRKVFVSESIFVASGSENRAVIIEVSPKNIGVYEVPNSNQLICTNHFQSPAYSKDKKNAQHIIESHSLYRYQRMEELLGAEPKINPQVAANILRNTDGLGNKKIGYGNEKALNQLLAHHAIIFKPTQKQVWISTNPYQLGEFVAYDLNRVFEKIAQQNPSELLCEKALNIEKDSFLYTKTYLQYEEFRNLRRIVLENIDQDSLVREDLLSSFLQSNPHYWEVHYIIGLYEFEHKNYIAAKQAFETALSKEVTTLSDKELIEKYLKKVNRKLK